MSQKPLNSFRKAERLCSHDALEQLYATGESMLVYPLRCVYRIVPMVDEPLRVMITAPKKNHRRAVHRNLLKRRIRETYRLNRGLLLDVILELNRLNIGHTVVRTDEDNLPPTESESSLLGTESHAESESSLLGLDRCADAESSLLGTESHADAESSLLGLDRCADAEQSLLGILSNTDAELSLVALEFSLSYIAKEIVDYQTIENAVQKTLTKLGHRLANRTH